MHGVLSYARLAKPVTQVGHEVARLFPPYPVSGRSAVDAASTICSICLKFEAGRMTLPVLNRPYATVRLTPDNRPPVNLTRLSNEQRPVPVRSSRIRCPRHSSRSNG